MNDNCLQVDITCGIGYNQGSSNQDLLSDWLPMLYRHFLSPKTERTAWQQQCRAVCFLGKVDIMCWQTALFAIYFVCSFICREGQFIDRSAGLSLAGRFYFGVFRTMADRAKAIMQSGCKHRGKAVKAFLSDCYSEKPNKTGRNAKMPGGIRSARHSWKKEKV